MGNRIWSPTTATVKNALTFSDHFVNGRMARRRDREPWIRDQFLQFTEVVLDLLLDGGRAASRRATAREREVPLERIPVWMRAGSIIVTYPAWQVASGLGDEGGRDELQRPLVATLWGVPRRGRTAARLADGGRIGWRDGRWQLPAGREIKVF
jgi:hypothetical protein